MSTKSISIELNNRTLSIDINKVARQADGSTLVRYGDTIMFVAATSKKEAKEPKPFLPLIVDYRENTYAAGKIPGGFFKREGRPSEREILLSRLIDRPIRSLFPEGYYFETQIVALLLSADLENTPETLGLIGASTALYCSDIPFTTPIGAVKMGLNNDRFIVNPTVAESEDCALNMIIVGAEEGIVMLEAGAAEVEDEKIIQAVEIARDPINQIIQMQKDAYAQLNVEKRIFVPMEIDQSQYGEIEAKAAPRIKETFRPYDKLARDADISQILEDITAEIPEENEEQIAAAKNIYYDIYKKMVRGYILKEKKRTDGRSFDEIRPINIEVGLLPRTHGSALFTRGETQCLATVTLGTFEDVQRIDGLGEESEKRFMLHYNFPPFSVGEVSFLRGPGRREIGHGALAEKSILPSIPESEEDFPYTIRIVSDILESNGSSSMATVCGGVLSLMDAGVPLSMIVAGMAIGLVKEGDDYAVLTDIAGAEDHYGDMDLKVAGTEKGVTAVQMDLKISSISLEILREALLKARNARMEVLSKMKAAIPEPRKEISPYAPRILNLFINPEKVGEVIGPSGKTIKKIVAETGAKIDIDETGKVTIASPEMEAAERALQIIKDLTTEAEMGKVYTGKVIRIEDYGVFVEILPNVVGLLHISEYAHTRTRSIRDEVNMGDTLRVKVINIDHDGKVKVSKKALEEAPLRAEGSQRTDEYNRPDGRPRSSGYRRRNYDSKKRY